MALQNSILRSVFILLVWGTITMGGALLQVSPGSPLTWLVSNQVYMGVALALAFLLIIVYKFNWVATTGLQLPENRKSWVLLWFPGLFVLAFFAAATAKGLPGVSGYLFYNHQYNNGWIF